MLTLSEFRAIGREQRYLTLNPLLCSFVSMWGPVGIHSRIRAGHVISGIRALSLPSEARILDAGCGRGLVLFWLAQHYPSYRLHGIEVIPELMTQVNRIVNAMALPNITFEVGDLALLDLPQGQYDLVCSSDVLEHIEDDVGVLRRFRLALNERGKLLLHLPLRHQEQRRIFPSFRQHVVSDHVRDEYLPEEILDKLDIAGFELLNLHYGFGRQGELAFELNNLFWKRPVLRAILALLSYPFSWYLAYRDVNVSHIQGNSFVILARPKTEVLVL